MDEKKVVYVQRGQTLTVESLTDEVTGKGFFIVKDADGRAVRTSEICTTEGVVFTADEARRTFSHSSLEYEIYLALKERMPGSWGMQREKLGSYGEVNYMLTKNVAKVVSSSVGGLGLSASTCGRICRSLGFRYVRTAEGWAVVVEEQDLATAASRFRLDKKG